MYIEFDNAIPESLLDAAWKLYNRAFDELRRSAVQRHVMSPEEFHQVMTDRRIWKYRAVDHGDGTKVTALATFTNDLHTMPLISPDYFEHRWPRLYAENRIWYNGFFAIDQEYRGSGIFERVITHMWQRVLDSEGIAVLDICRRNDQLGLPGAIHQVLLSLSPGTRASRIDEQTYWLYEPAAA